MSGQAPDLNTPLRIEVLIDGKRLEIPDASRKSWPAIRTYLEMWALNQGRVVSFFTLEGVVIHIQKDEVEFKTVERVQADTITFNDLSQQLLSAACERIKQLKARVETAAVRVLINDWPAVETLWNEWAAEFKSPILIVNFLRDLCGKRLDELGFEGQSLAQHLALFDPIWNEVSAVYGRRDTLELSNVLEYRYLPSLHQLHVYLGQLDKT
jgi:hypothetical protein